jgi:hypothetical protein
MIKARCGLMEREILRLEITNMDLKATLFVTAYTTPRQVSPDVTKAPRPCFVLQTETDSKFFQNAFSVGNVRPTHHLIQHRLVLKKE